MKFEAGPASNHTLSCFAFNLLLIQCKVMWDGRALCMYESGSNPLYVHYGLSYNNSNPGCCIKSIGYRRAASSSYWLLFSRREGGGNGHKCVDFIFMDYYCLCTYQLIMLWKCKDLNFKFLVPRIPPPPCSNLLRIGSAKTTCPVASWILSDHLRWVSLWASSWCLAV
jgi:hypothetical protein